MDDKITKRLTLANYFKNTKKKLVKSDFLGKGGQGSVYKFCSDKNKCMAIKKMYLNEKESKYVNNPYDRKALKYSNYIELTSMKLINEIIKQKICPNFILNYSFKYKEREGICNDLYPYTSYFYNEYINNSQIYTEWVKEIHSIEEWTNAYFQIICCFFLNILCYWLWGR